MKHAKKHIDDLFREKLGDYAEVPPADSWSDLDARLDVLTPAVPHTPLHWLGHVGMVSVIAVLGVSVLSRFVSDRAGISAGAGSEGVAKVEVANPMASEIVAQNSAGEVAVPEAENAVAGNVAEIADAESIGVDKSAGGEPKGSMAGVSLSNRGKSKAHKALSRVLLSEKKGSKVNRTEGTSQQEIVPNSSSKNANDNNQYIDNQLNNKIQRKSATPKVTVPVVSARHLLRNDPDPLAAAKEKANVDFPRWSVGVKLGYERGADNVGAKKAVVAPYLQYNISRRVAIMTQPAIKMANSPVRNISSRSYYKVNDDGTVTTVNNYVEPRAEGGVVDTYYFSRFRYTQSHDSIVKNETIGGRYLEFELPVMMRYAVAKNVSVYGGLNMIFSQLSGVKQSSYSKQLTRSADSLQFARSVTPSPVDIKDVIKYDGTPIAEYDGPLYPSSQVNRLRLGATVGVTYEYSGRWLLDALVQQNPAPKDMRGAYNINAPLSSTYFRLSVGYKLTK
ncbi:MAG: hypothetical protein KF744_16005 [Taibaiella sp.]|nr:hypothetical protein [Taibaiella sp.]